MQSFYYGEYVKHKQHPKVGKSTLGCCYLVPMGNRVMKDHYDACIDLWMTSIRPYG